MTSALIAVSLLFPQVFPHHDAVNLKYKNFLVRQVRFLWGLDEEVSTFAAQIRQESNWNPNARSPYATGLTQFTPNTANWISGVYPELADGFFTGPDRRLDWKWSIRAMVRYDRLLYTKLAKMRQSIMQRSPAHAAWRTQLWTLTLRAYNGGIGWLQKELRGCETMDFACCDRYRRKSACRENIGYPQKILTKWKPMYEAWDR